MTLRRTFSTFLIVFLMLLSGIFSFPEITHAQVGSRSCPTGTTPRRQYDVITGLPRLTFECVNTDGIVVGYSDVFGYTSANTKCDSTSSYFNFICWGRWLGSWFASWIISFAVFLLELTGATFNWMMENAIIKFADYYASYLQTGIETAWTLFRDIANILIIGMFTFIAISMILGNETYGAKKMVARVLIIAVLINFSLLFTKIILDVSHFTASVFYNATNLQAGGSGTPAVGAQTAQTPQGTAGLLIEYMGIKRFSQSTAALNNMADDLNNGFKSFLYGLIVASFVLGIAIVFAYAIYLIVFRTVVIVFLMLTSAIAFATYLIPKVSEGSWGWSAWWKELINNAIFAPLIMMLLWATVIIAQKISGTTAGLAGIITDRNGSVAVSAVFGYAIILGMLFASIKIANSFSNQMAQGFVNRTFGRAFRGGLAAPLVGTAALGARVGGLAWRGTAGRGMLAGGRALMSKSADYADKFKTEGGARNWLASRALEYGGRVAGRGAKTEGNVLQNRLGGMLARQVGLSQQTLVGKVVGGARGAEEARIKAFAERGKEMAKGVSESLHTAQEQVDGIRRSNAALAEKFDEAQADRDLAQRAVDANKSPEAKVEEQTRVEKEIREKTTQHDTAVKEEREAAATSETKETERKVEIKGRADKIDEIRGQINEARARATAPGASADASHELADLETRLRELSIEHQRKLFEENKQREEEQRNLTAIQSRSSALKTQVGKLENLNRVLHDASPEAGKNAESWLADTEKKLASVSGEVKAAFKKQYSAEALGAERARNRLTGALWRQFVTKGKDTRTDERLSGEARDALKKEAEKKRFHERFGSEEVPGESKTAKPEAEEPKKEPPAAEAPTLH